MIRVTGTFVSKVPVTHFLSPVFLFQMFQTFINPVQSGFKEIVFFL